MDDFEISTPVYLVDGILESGKTSFLNFTIRQDYFQVDGTTLLISCEEGEEEYDEKDLLKYHTVLETIEEPEDLTLSTLRAFEKKYRPERVIIEYNPLWGVNKLRAMVMPPGWGICQEIVIIDGGSYEIYRNNMQSVFTEMVQDADMVIFNRCKTSMSLANYRRGLVGYAIKDRQFFHLFPPGTLRHPGQAAARRDLSRHRHQSSRKPGPMTGRLHLHGLRRVREGHKAAVFPVSS